MLSWFLFCCLGVSNTFATVSTGGVTMENKFRGAAAVGTKVVFAPYNADVVGVFRIGGYAATYEPCSPGSYTDATGATECEPCPSDTAAGAQSDPGLRFFSFEDQAAGASGATLNNFASTELSGQSEEGLVFDGENDHVVLPSWAMGGATSVEAFVKYESFNLQSRVIDFGNGADTDNIWLGNLETASDAGWVIYQEDANKHVAQSNFWALGAWVHVVATVTDGGVMHLFKDGVLKATNLNGHAPRKMTRTRHYVGKAHVSSIGNFHGTIRYVGVYDRALAPADQASATTAFRIGLAGASAIAPAPPFVLCDKLTPPHAFAPPRQAVAVSSCEACPTAASGSVGAASCPAPTTSPTMLLGSSFVRVADGDVCEDSPMCATIHDLSVCHAAVASLLKATDSDGEADLYHETGYVHGCGVLAASGKGYFNSDSATLRKCAAGKHDCLCVCVDHTAAPTGTPSASPSSLPTTSAPTSLVTTQPLSAPTSSPTGKDRVEVEVAFTIEGGDDAVSGEALRAAFAATEVLAFEVRGGFVEATLLYADADYFTTKLNARACNEGGNCEATDRLLRSLNATSIRDFQSEVSVVEKKEAGPGPDNGLAELMDAAKVVIMIVAVLAAAAIFLAPRVIDRRSGVQPVSSAALTTDAASDRRSSADDLNAELAQKLAAAAARGETEAVAELTAELARAVSQHSAGGVHHHISWKRLLCRLDTPSRVTISMELIDVGTDGTAWLSVVALAQRSECGEDLDGLAAGLLAVFCVAFLLQVGRWLYLRREYSRPQANKARKFRLAVFAVTIGVLEDAPQTALALMVGSRCGGLDWGLQASVAVSFTSVAWKLMTPLLILYDFL